MSFWSECEIEWPAEPIHFSGLSVFSRFVGIFFSVEVVKIRHLELDIFIVSLVIDPCFFIKSIQKVFNLLFFFYLDF